VGVMNADDGLLMLRMQPSCTCSAVSSIPGWYGQSGPGLPMRNLNGVFIQIGSLWNCCREMGFFGIDVVKWGFLELML
jgi:hypothetical protein